MRLKNVKGAKEAVENHPLVIKSKGEFEALNIESDVYLEIGCGKGQFVLNKALNDLSSFYIGVEMYSSVLYRALEKCEISLGLSPRGVADRLNQLDPKLFDKFKNLRFINTDALNLSTIFKPSSIKGIYLNFSDPWPKDRHAKRRLTSTRFLNEYKKYLINGGTIEFKTDNKELFDFSVDEFNNHKDYELIDYTYDLYNDDVMNSGNVQTEYEMKFLKANKQIMKLIARLK